MTTPLLELKNLKIAYGGINAVKGSRQAGNRGSERGFMEAPARFHAAKTGLAPHMPPACGDVTSAVANLCPEIA